MAAKHTETVSASEPTDVRPFLLMIHLLDEARLAGSAVMLRSTLAIALIKLNKNVYAEAGVGTFKAYSTLAQTRGFVSMGGTSGNTWITLNPEWYGRGRKQ